MELKKSIQRAAVVVGILALVSITAVAQENRSEISIQGTGFFTKDTAGNGTFERANDTGGFLIGYRYLYEVDRDNASLALPRRSAGGAAVTSPH